ncbi:MAG TPA: M56 family metallopeptidase [Allosphingosinicella sp.]
MSIEFFTDMAWKSALISGAALGLAFALRSRSPADRALVLRLGIAMLLLLPPIAVALPALEIVAFAAPAAQAPLPYALPPEVQLTALAGPAAATAPTIWDDPTPLVLIAYLSGLALALGRLLDGLATLHRWTRRAHAVTCPEWLAAFEGVRWVVPNAEAVRLLVSEEVASPLSWGWRRPVILIDTDTLGAPDDAEAILAHEVAHIARRDWPALILSQAAAALFWFNPLVWKLEREAVQQAEEAADIAAAERVEPARYAETLLSWAQFNHAVPANSIAPGASALGRRIRAVLDRRSRERPTGSAWTALAMLLCVGIAAPVAAARLVAAEPPQAPDPPAVPVAPEAPPAPAAPQAPEAPVPPEAAEAITISVPHLAEVERIRREALAAVTPHIPTIVANATAGVHPEAMRDALRQAEAEMRRMPHLDGAHIEAAMREAARARSRALAFSQREVRLAMREAERASQAAHASMLRGAEGMMRGADGMERGARNMAAEAERLQDRDYRERQIARARARGETVTHEELLEAAEGLREGAEGMREGARDMREAARDMREQQD